MMGIATHALHSGALHPGVARSGPSRKDEDEESKEEGELRDRGVHGSVTRTDIRDEDEDMDRDAAVIASPRSSRWHPCLVPRYADVPLPMRLGAPCLGPGRIDTFHGSATGSKSDPGLGNVHGTVVLPPSPAAVNYALMQSRGHWVSQRWLSTGGLGSTNTRVKSGSGDEGDGDHDGDGDEDGIGRGGGKWISLAAPIALELLRASHGGAYVR